MDDSDEALIARHREGDGAAFTELVRRHQKPLYFFALRMSGSAEDAADLTQRAFVRAYKALDRFEGRSSFSTWMFQIIGNLCRNHHRDTTRVQHVPIDEARLPQAPRVVERLIEAQARAELKGAVEGLPSRQRAVLELRVYEDLPFKEIAEREGITEGNARVSYHLAVKALKGSLGTISEEVAS